jgi:hypothetical protein
MVDEILKELWVVKEEIARDYGCDPKQFIKHCQDQKKSVDARRMNDIQKKEFESE